MRTRRIHPTVALIAIAVMGLGACAADDEIVTRPVVAEYDLICEATTPDDLCLEVADLAVDAVSSGLDMRLVVNNFDIDVPIEANDLDMRVEVKPTDCADIGRGPTANQHPPATRCWRIEGSLPDLDLQFGRWVYELPDGTLGETG